MVWLQAIGLWSLLYRECEITKRWLNSWKCPETAASSKNSRIWMLGRRQWPSKSSWVGKGKARNEQDLTKGPGKEGLLRRMQLSTAKRSRKMRNWSSDFCKMPKLCWYCLRSPMHLLNCVFCLTGSGCGRVDPAQVPRDPTSF